MTRVELIAFLKQRDHGVVATIGPRGGPHAAVVGIATADDGSIVFDTAGTTRKARDLRRDPRIALTVWEGERTVQLEGRAVEPAGEARERALAQYLAAFPEGRERLAWPDITHFCIKPEWARYSDFDPARSEPLIVELTFEVT